MGKKKVENPAHQRMIPGVCCQRCEYSRSNTCPVHVDAPVSLREFFCAKFVDHAGKGIIAHIRPLDRQGYISPGAPK